MSGVFINTAVDNSYYKTNLIMIAWSTKLIWTKVLQSKVWWTLFMYFRRQHGHAWKGVNTSLCSTRCGKERYQDNVLFAGTVFLQHIQSSTHSSTTLYNVCIHTCMYGKNDHYCDLGDSFNSQWSHQEWVSGEGSFYSQYSEETWHNKPTTLL